jgi:hypothetical protein
MKGNRSLLILIGVAVVIIVGWWLIHRGGRGAAIDLLAHFDAAEKRPSAGVFTIEDVTINGDTKRSIAVAPSVGTRLKFREKIPDDGWLRVNLGFKAEAWQKPGDGIRFMVLASDGRAAEELFKQDVNPFGTPTDRKWIPVMVDLSSYAGEEVELIFNTYASPPGKVGDTNNDLAVWGAPEIVVR